MRRILVLLLALSMFASAAPKVDDETSKSQSPEAMFWAHTTLLQTRTPLQWVQLFEEGLMHQTLEQEAMENVVGGEEVSSLVGVDGGKGDLLLFRNSANNNQYSIHENAADEASLTVKPQQASEFLVPFGDVNEDGHTDIAAIRFDVDFDYDFNTGGTYFEILIHGRIFDARTEAFLGEYSAEFYVEDKPEADAIAGVEPDTAFIRSETKAGVRIGDESISSLRFEEWTYKSADIYLDEYQLGQSVIERNGHGYIERNEGTSRIEFDTPVTVLEFPDSTGDDVPELVVGSIGSYRETQDHTLIVSDPVTSQLSGSGVYVLDGAAFEILAEGPWDEMSAITQGPIPGSFIIHELTDNGFNHLWLGEGDPWPMTGGWHTYSGFPDINDDGEPEWLRKDVDPDLLDWGFGPQFLVDAGQNAWVETKKGEPIWASEGEYISVSTKTPSSSFYSLNGQQTMLAFGDAVEMRTIDNQMLSSVANAEDLSLIDAVDGGLEWLVISAHPGEHTGYNATLVDAGNNKTLWSKTLFSADGGIDFQVDSMDHARGSEAREIIVNVEPWAQYTIVCDNTGCHESVNREADFHRVILIDGATGKTVQQFRSGVEERGIYETSENLQQTSYGRSVEKDLPGAPLLLSLALLAFLVRRKFS